MKVSIDSKGISSLEKKNNFTLDISFHLFVVHMLNLKRCNLRGSTHKSSLSYREGESSQRRRGESSG